MSKLMNAMQLANRWCEHGRNRAHQFVTSHLRLRRMADDAMTLRDLSVELGVSRERLQQIEPRAFEREQDAAKASPSHCFGYGNASDHTPIRAPAPIHSQPADARLPGNADPIEMEQVMKRFAVVIAWLLLDIVSASAGSPPQFDVRITCHRAVPLLGDGDNNPYEDCMKDEIEAQGELIKSWASFKPEAQRVCTQETQIGGAPSYVELLTCLQLDKQAEEASRENHLPMSQKSPQRRSDRALPNPAAATRSGPNIEFVSRQQSNWIATNIRRTSAHLTRFEVRCEAFRQSRART